MPIDLLHGYLREQCLPVSSRSGSALAGWTRCSCGASCWESRRLLPALLATCLPYSALVAEYGRRSQSAVSWMSPRLPFVSSGVWAGLDRGLGG